MGELEEEVKEKIRGEVIEFGLGLIYLMWSTYRYLNEDILGVDRKYSLGVE